MKRIYVNEQWCLGCHLCEYNCAFANSGQESMAHALKGVKIHPRIAIEEHGDICFSVSCRHCTHPDCVHACISGALSVNDGLITIDPDKCVSCFSCVLACPYGAISPSESGAMQKCELCTKNAAGQPACVAGCPNNAIVYEER